VPSASPSQADQSNSPINSQIPLVSPIQAKETTIATKIQDDGTSKSNAGAKADSQATTDGKNSSVPTKNIGIYVGAAVAASLFMAAGFVTIRWAVHRTQSNKKDREGQFVVPEYDPQRDSDATGFDAFRRGSNASASEFDALWQGSNASVSEFDALRRGSNVSTVTGRSRSNSMESIYGESHPRISMSRPAYFNDGSIPLSVIMSNFPSPMDIDHVQTQQLTTEAPSHPVPLIKEDVPLPEVPPSPSEYQSDLDNTVLKDALAFLEGLEDDASLSGTGSMLSQHIPVYSKEDVKMSQYQGRRRSSTVGIYSPLAKAVLSKRAPQPALEDSTENYWENYDQLEASAEHTVYNQNSTTVVENPDMAEPSIQEQRQKDSEISFNSEDDFMFL
jgi:hypothetical protein